jgi:hypothetical protein
MSEHTAGPWYRDGYKSDVVRSAIVRDATGFEVALTRHWGVKETEANANLIAAAPETLEALRDAARLIRHLGGDAQFHERAIAKAEGK